MTVASTMEEGERSDKAPKMRQVGDFAVKSRGSVDPSRHVEEIFELFSIPAYDQRQPELLLGAEIGSSKKIVSPGDVLISRIVPHIQRVWVVGPSRGYRQIASGEWIVFGHSETDPNYLRHMLLSTPFHEQFMQTVAGMGGSLMRARPSEVERIEIPLPASKAEQRRIAAILDKADAVRRKREQARALADDFLKSVFLEMFGQAYWPTSTLAEVVATGTIVTYGIVQAGPEIECGIPYIRTGDIKNGEIVLNGLRHTSPEIASKFNRSRVKAGEIVMSIRATVGTTAVVPPELDGANLTQGTARIAPGENTTLEFLLSYLRSQKSQEWIESQVKGATFREITLTRLRELPVPLPPIAVQEEYSVLYRKARQMVARLSADLFACNELFASLSQRAFRGEL